MTDDDSVRRAFDQADDVDLVVNNAAVMWFGSTEETDGFAGSRLPAS